MRFALPRIVAFVAAVMALLLASVPAALAQSSGCFTGPAATVIYTYDGFIDIPHNGDSVPGSGSRQYGRSCQERNQPACSAKPRRMMSCGPATVWTRCM